jgi:hypothetical protein
MLQIGIFSALTALAYSSCQKGITTTSTTANSNLKIQIQAVNKSVSLPVQSGTAGNALMATGAAVTWDTASFVVSTVRFSAVVKSKLAVVTPANEDEHHHGFSKDSIEVQYTWNGPQTVDLFNLNTVFGSFVLGPGFYNDIELFVKGMKSDAGTKPVFYLAGRYTTASLATRRIVVAVAEDVAFKTDQDSVTVAGTGVNFVSVIQVFLDKLMANIPVSSLDNAVLQSNGDLLISKNANPDLYRIMGLNLRLNHPFHHHKEGEPDRGHDS